MSSNMTCSLARFSTRSQMKQRPPLAASSTFAVYSFLSSSLRAAVLPGPEPGDDSLSTCTGCPFLRRARTTQLPIYALLGLPVAVSQATTA